MAYLVHKIIRKAKDVLSRHEYSLKYAFLNVGSSAVGIYVVTFVLLVYLDPIDYQFSVSKYYRVLNIQAQVLGTFLAILFSTTVVIAELVSRYSERVLTEVLGGWAVYYLVVYILGVTFPLYLIYSDFWFLGVQISLFLGGLCIFLLFPFSVSLKYFLSIDYYIDKLSKQADDIISDSQEGSIGTKVRSISDITERIAHLGLGSTDYHDYRVFERCLDGIKEVWVDTISSIDISVDDFDEQNNPVRDEVIGPIAKTARAKMNDPKVPYECAQSIREIGKKGIRMGSSITTEECQSSLRKIGQSAARKKSVGDKVTVCIRGLASIGRLASKKGMASHSKDSISHLRNIVCTPELEKIPNCSFLVYLCLDEIAKICNYIIRHNRFSDIKDVHEEVATESFKNIYKTCVALIELRRVEASSLAIAKCVSIVDNYHKNSPSNMPDQDQESLAQKSVQYAIEIAKTVRENKPSSKWPEVIEVMTYFVQNCVENGDIGSADRLLDELDKMVRQVVDRAGADHPIWETCGKLGYVVQQYLKADPERADKAHELLRHVSDRAMEESISTEAMTDLLRAHRSVLQRKGG